MDMIKIIGIGMISLIVVIILKQYKPEFAIYASLVGGLLILLMVLAHISGLINLLQSISNKANINGQFLGILLKITGIAFLTEFATSISNDCGETAIANKIDLGGKVIIITISLPIITSLLETILKIIP